MKTCFKCRRELELSEFYRHPMMADGHLGKCKECTRRDVRDNRNSRREYYQEYDRTRYYVEHEKRKEASRRWGLKNKAASSSSKAISANRYPEKTKARQVLNNAVKSGAVTPCPCARCGSFEKTHGHHEDYSKPLDVVWLCPACHGLRHAEINRGRRQKKTA